MSTTSSVLEGESRPKLNLLDLPQEIKDQIYGYVVCGRYIIVPAAGDKSCTQRRDMSILQVSSRLKVEALQVLWRRSSFVYNPHQCWAPAIHEVHNQHMMNVELIVGHHCTYEYMGRVILGFAGVHILRRTCHILIPELSSILVRDSNTPKNVALRLYFQYIRLLIGFATVVIQVDLCRTKKKRGAKYDDERAKLLRDMIEFSGLALGPAVPCDSVRERYDVNFRFSPRRFVAERLARDELGVGG